MIYKIFFLIHLSLTFGCISILKRRLKMKDWHLIKQNLQYDNVIGIFASKSILGCAMQKFYETYCT